MRVNTDRKMMHTAGTMAMRMLMPYFRLSSSLCEGSTLRRG